MTDPIARRLRSNMTDAERMLWRAIRDKQVESVKFRRQQRIGAFIVDFVALAERLVIEVDGGQHDGADDAARDAFCAPRVIACCGSGTMR